MTNKILFIILKMALNGKFLFFIISNLLKYGAIIMRKQSKKQLKNSKFNLGELLKSQNLKLLETFVFNGKEVYKVRNKNGKSLILKTSGIEVHQEELLKIAKSMENELCFSVPEFVASGEGWILMEDVGINGAYLLDIYDKDPKIAVDVTAKISEDYKKVVNKFLENRSPGNLLEDGKKWLFSRLLLWSSSLVEAEMISFEDVKKFGERFESIVDKKGESFFGWVHGNIMGDHIIIRDSRPYLLDLSIVPRAGREYYDFLRALDFMFLKSERFEKLFPVIVKSIKEFSKNNDLDFEEMKLVFAFRNIGILGWDVLYSGDPMGDNKRKQRLMLKFIKQEY